MAAGEKEKAMDRLVAQALRRGLQAAGVECPAPETLAAYYDRSLKASEAAQCEFHLSRCLHCQQVLAALAVSEPEESPARETHPFILIARHLNWRWLAPAVAAAGAIALWVAIRPNPMGQQAPPPAVAERTAPATPAKGPSSESTEVAQNRAPPKPSLKLRMKAETSAAARLAQPSAVLPKPEKPGGTLGRLSERTGRAETVEGQAGAQPGALAAGAPGVAAARVAPAEEKNEADQKRAAPPTPAEQVTAEPAPQAADKIAVLKTQPQAGVAAYSATPAAPGPETPKDSAKRLAEPERPSAGSLMKAAPGRAIRAAARSAFFLIATPNPALIWRASHGGQIERSSDAGHTWAVQQSGVTTDLMAGSAPSETVCWVVGRAGTILRTIDGEHWQKISSPTRSDLISIEAQDALHAILVTAGHTRYFTEDGGQTWRPQ